MKKIKQEFLSFLNEYSVVGIAVGIVMGNAVSKLVTSIVSDLVMPFLGIMIPWLLWSLI